MVLGLRELTRNVLAEWTKKVNRVVADIQTTNITDTNKLINATAIYIGRQIGLKVGVAREKEPKNLGGKGESKTLLQSYGGTSTSSKDLNKGN